MTPIDEAAQPYRSPILGGLLLIVSIIMLLAAAIIYVVLGAAAEGALDIGLVGSLGLIVASVLLSLAGLRLFALSRKMRTWSVADLLAADPRPPVVYLRSFSSDDDAADVLSDSREAQVAVPASTEEEHLAAVFREIGPFIAIGRPGEELATRGATRLYVSDAQWQTSVTDWLTRCRLVLLRPGVSVGLLWELQQAVMTLQPNQLVLAISFGPEEYDRFGAHVDSWLPSRLPPHPGADQLVGTLHGLILFDENWRGTFRTFPKKRLYRSQLRAALQPVLDRHRRMLLSGEEEPPSVQR